MAKRKYTDMQRWAIAVHCVDKGVSLREASRRTGIPVRTIKGWVQKFEDGKLPIPPSPKGTFSNPA